MNATKKGYDDCIVDNISVIYFYWGQIGVSEEP